MLRTGQFLLLGSASLDLVQHASETLSGRVVHLDLAPIGVEEARGAGVSADALESGRFIAEPAAPWRQYRVLEGRPIKLCSGLDCTTPKRISVPTASRAYTRFIHPGCAPRMKTQ